MRNLFSAVSVFGALPAVRRKRLQHIADTVCHMFCGWRLANSYSEMAKLGTGTLEIDVLTGTSKFEGASIPELNIAGELEHWVKDDLDRSSIPIEAIHKAVLIAKLQFSEIERGNRRTKAEYFDSKQKHVGANIWHRCVISCSSSIETDEVVYSSSYEDIEEWPDGWPSA